MKGIDAVRRIVIAGALLAAAGLVAAQQAYPNKPIRFLIPNAAGGTTSVVARLVGQKLTESWGQPVIVDNRPGGNNVIASEALVKSPPDGHTIMLATAAHSINPLIFRNQPYDAIKDFAAVATLVSTDYILVLHPSVPANTLQEFIAYAKARPGQLNGAVSNAGGIQHLALELFNILAGVKLQAVPYKGGGPGITDLVGGQVQLAFNNSIAVLPHVRSGRLKALGIGGEQRLSVLPDVPTFAEAGLPGYNAKNWFGILVPVRTPKEIINKMAGEIARIQAMPDFKEKLATQGVEPFVSGPEQFAALIKSDMAKYAKIIKTANIKMEN